MKKNIFLISLLLTFLSVNAQKLILNDFNDGIRHAVCSEERISGLSDQVAILTCLSLITDGTKKEYSLIMTFNSATKSFTVEKGMKLLLKTTDDEIIVLEAEQSKSSEKEFDFSFSDYSSYNHLGLTYSIKEEDLIKLKKGVKKLRFEHTLDYYDKEFKKDKMGNFIFTEYLMLRDLIANHKNGPKKDVMQDF